MTEDTPPRGEETREKILQTAHRLFAGQGYHGTSMRQIAEGAGVALGGLYNHFASKDEVFEAVFRDFHPYHEILPALARAKGETAEAFVRDAAGKMLSALEARPDFMHLVFIEVVEFNSVHANQLFAELFPRGLQIVKRLIQVGGDRMRPIPPLMVMRAFLGLFFSYYLTEIVFAPQAPPEFREGAMEHLVEVFLHGILRD